MKLYVMRFLWVLVLVSSSDVLAADSTTVAEAAQHAVEQSKLTLPGSAPFHLKAKIVEKTNPSSDYKAEIEEYWVSPSKWRRTITSPTFSQARTVNGDDVYEENKGDYFPWWLNDLVTAIFDPLPMIDTLKNINSPLGKPSGGEHSIACARMEAKVGTPPAVNTTYFVLCFEGGHGLIESIVSPGYDADFKKYKSFKGKQVSRLITIDPEPGTTIEASVTELDELTNPDKSMFAVDQPTPIADRLKSIMVSDEATVHKLIDSAPDILWPTVRSGKTSGVLSMYVSVDRSGRVREAWPLNSDNAGLEDPAREQIKAWRFKTANSDGQPVQVETVITLPFTTKIGDPILILSDEDARKLASNVVNPVFPPGTPSGTEVKVQLGVTLDGKVNGVGNPYSVPTPLFMAAAGALRQWHFRPYIRDGKPDIFGADIVFRVP